MTPVSVICARAASVILQHHPELADLMTFSASVPAICRGMHMIELRIDAVDYSRVREIAASVTPHPHGPGRMWPLGKILDHYCSHEPHNGRDFELAGLAWLIGDGDDSLALSEVSSTSVILWVRAWED